ncbi:MAG: hypothetical protein M3357_11520 [Actinomycetota bacterium]|nr:hypothetical protein [Actinomycetota bacterium]
MTTYVLEPAAAATGLPIPFPDADYSPVTRNHLDLIGVGPGWRCLVVGGSRSVTSWLEARVGETSRVLTTGFDAGGTDGPDGAILEANVTTRPLPMAWFDLVYVQLGRLPVRDRARTVHNLLAAVRPGGWVLIEDHVSLPFQLPEDGAGDAPSSATVVEAIGTVAAHRAADLDWARRVPGLLRARGCTEVATEGYCSVWPGGSVTTARRGAPHDPAAEGPAAGAESPVELEPFRRLLVNPFRGGLVPRSLAVKSYVVFSTWARR